MKWQIVPREARNRELPFDQEVVDALLNDETIEVTEGFNRRLYQKVAEQLGFRLRTTTKKDKTVVFWFERVTPDMPKLRKLMTEPSVFEDKVKA